MSIATNLRKWLSLPIFIVNLTSRVTGSMAMNIEILFAIELKASLSDIALMSLVGGITGIILHVPKGILSDKAGRKPAILLAELLTLIYLLANIGATQPWHLILASFFKTATFTPAFLSLVADIAKPEERSEAVGALYVCNSLGMLVGPSITSVLLLFLPLRSIYYICCVLKLGLITLIMLKIKEPERKHSQKSEGTISERSSRILKNRGLLVAIGSGLSLFFNLSLLRIYIPVFARQELGVSDALVVSLNTFRSLTVLITRLFISKIIKELTVKRTLLLMLSVLILGGLIIPLSRSYLHLSLIYIVFGFSHGAIPTIAGLIVMNAYKPDERGTAHSVFELFGFKIPNMIVPTLMNPIAEGLGLTYVFPIGAILPFITTILTFILVRSI